VTGVAPSRDTRERAYRANNVGVALLEQLKYPDAAEAFRGAVAIDGTFGIARLNLALALLSEQDLDGGTREASEAARLMRSAPQPPYVLGLAARAQNRNDERRYFQQVLESDRGDVGANVNLVQINLEDRRYDEAVTALQPIVDAEPYHVAAAYVFRLALTRSGKTRRRAASAGRRAGGAPRQLRGHLRNRLPRTGTIRRSHRVDRRRTGWSIRPHRPLDLRQPMCRPRSPRPPAEEPSSGVVAVPPNCQ
jgi:tetratricopeptide (TPR) repeat protein